MARVNDYRYCRKKDRVYSSTMDIGQIRRGVDDDYETDEGLTNCETEKRGTHYIGLMHLFQIYVKNHISIYLVVGRTRR